MLALKRRNERTDDETNERTNERTNDEIFKNDQKSKTRRKDAQTSGGILQTFDW